MADTDGSRRRRDRSARRRRSAGDPDVATSPDAPPGEGSPGEGTPGDVPGHATDAADEASDPQADATEEQPALAPLLQLREPLPEVIETDAALLEVCRLLEAAQGPVAIDAERASGYRYSSRAYLIQLRREGAGTALIDPLPLSTLQPLAQALDGVEWILHAATQDLPCLAEVGLRPAQLFDTELAGRLLGYPRVGLATLVEELLGQRMRKEHSAADWSTRPLPRPWLEYAALDVEVLNELREHLIAELDQAGKTEWARQEFDALLTFAPAQRIDPWRRTSGAHAIRGRRGQAAVRSLWEARDRIAQERDVAPGRLIPDSAIVVAAQAMPTDKAGLMRTHGFHGRGARRYADEWVAALAEAAALPESELPTRLPRTDGPPPPRAWAERDPVAARRLGLARTALADLAGRLNLPQENLITPDTVRRLMWQPPESREAEGLRLDVESRLESLGARAWQREHTAGLLTEAILSAEQPT